MYIYIHIQGRLKEGGKPGNCPGPNILGAHKLFEKHFLLFIKKKIFINSIFIHSISLYTINFN